MTDRGMATCPRPSQVGELESERGAVEIELETVQKRPSGLARGCLRKCTRPPGCGIVVEVLRGQVHPPSPFSITPRGEWTARRGTPHIRPMK